MQNPNVLEVRVIGVNRANAYANELAPRLSEVFVEFVGQQIEKATGGLLKKVQDKVNALNLPNTVKLSVYRYASSYSLTYTVKTSETKMPEGHAYYHETSIYVGSLQNGVLTEVKEYTPAKTDYTAAEVERLRKRHQRLREMADKARSAISEFGEWDR